MTVISIGADHIVIRPDRRDGTDSHRFFPDIEVQKAGNFGERIHFRRFFFESTNEEHLAVQGEKIV
jgi:hypothetical protein